MPSHAARGAMGFVLVLLQSENVQTYLCLHKACKNQHAYLQGGESEVAAEQKVSCMAVGS